MQAGHRHAVPNFQQNATRKQPVDCGFEATEVEFLILRNPSTCEENKRMRRWPLGLANMSTMNGFRYYTYGSNYATPI